MNKTLKLTSLSLLAISAAAYLALYRQSAPQIKVDATHLSSSFATQHQPAAMAMAQTRVQLPSGSDPNEQHLADDGDLLRATVAGLQSRGDDETAAKLLENHINRLSTEPPSATLAFETIDSLRMKADWARERGDHSQYSKLISQAWDLVMAEFNRTGIYPANALTIASYLRFDPHIQGGKEVRRKLAFEFLEIPQLKANSQYLMEFLTSARMFAESEAEFHKLHQFIHDPQVVLLRDQLTQQDRFVFDRYQAEIQLKRGDARAALASINKLLEQPSANPLPSQGAPSASPVNRARSHLLSLRIDSLRSLGETNLVIDERVELIKQLEQTAALAKSNQNITDLTLDQIRSNITTNESMLEGASNQGRPEVTLWVYERRLAANDFIDQEQRAIIQRHRDSLIAKMNHSASRSSP